MIAVAIVAFVLAGCISAYRAYRQVIPAGADFYPFWLASAQGPSLASPERRRLVHVVFNDAGGMHSGNHWTWLIVDDVLLGRRVVAEGYSHPNVRRGDVLFPLQWLDYRTFSVEFIKGRYAEALEKPVVIELP